MTTGSDRGCGTSHRAPGPPGAGGHRKDPPLKGAWPRHILTSAPAWALAVRTAETNVRFLSHQVCVICYRSCRSESGLHKGFAFP